MAHKGQYLLNRLTGNAITWLETTQDTDGEYIHFILTLRANTRTPARHIHILQDESIVVIEGQIKVEIGNILYLFKKGDQFVIPKGTPHEYWNASETRQLILDVKFVPACNTEIFLEQVFGLSNDNKCNSDGSLSFMQTMCMGNKYDLYFSGPPVFLQKFLYFVLGGVAKLLGYKDYYAKYDQALSTIEIDQPAGK